MFVKYFIERPIFSIVLVVIIVLIGVFSLYKVPLAQYPNILPPMLRISGFYPGASAETIKKNCCSPFRVST